MHILFVGTSHLSCVTFMQCLSTITSQKTYILYIWFRIFFVYHPFASIPLLKIIIHFYCFYTIHGSLSKILNPTGLVYHSNESSTWNISKIVSPNANNLTISETIATNPYSSRTILKFAFLYRSSPSHFTNNLIILHFHFVYLVLEFYSIEHPFPVNLRHEVGISDILGYRYSVKSLTEELRSEDISNRSFFITVVLEAIVSI